MAEYIKREALIEDLNSCGCITVYGRQFINAVTHRINLHPAADVVEVCRCKNCQHSRERNEEEKVYLIEGVLICTSPDATDVCWNPVFPEHFCSYGERRAE